LAHPDSPGLYILNPTARYAWYLLRVGKSFTEAVADFAAQYDISTDIAARDLGLTWREWEQSLLAPAPTPGPLPSPPTPPADSSLDAFSRTYRLHGKDIRVVLHNPDLIAEIAPRLEPLLAPASSHPRLTLQATAWGNGYHIFSGSTYLATEDHPAAARVLFLQELVRNTQPNRDWAAILHAGACGTDRDCVIFPAASHSGKTTLAAALMHAGMTFYGDDSIPLERESLTIPGMPFALMIREGSWPAVSRRFPNFSNAPVHVRYGENVRFLHPTRAAHHTSARAAAIVFSRWAPHATTAISSLDSFEVLVRLNDSSFWVAHDRDSIQAFLDWIQSLPSYEMLYSDLDEAVAFIAKLVRWDV